MKKLEWESELFGLQIGTAKLADFPNGIPTDKFDLLYITSDKDFIANIPGFINSFSETKTILIKNRTTHVNEKIDFSKNLLSAHTITLDENQKADLYRLAFECGKYSRYLLDPYFGEKALKKMYTAWVDNSLNGEIADDVILYVEDEKILGFIALFKNGMQGKLTLMAVDPAFQGRGIGFQLFKYAEQILFEQGVEEIILITKEKYKEAFKIYEKCNYGISERTELKHYWRNDTI